MEIQHACRYSSQSGLSSTKIAQFNLKITPGSRREKGRKKREEEKRTAQEAETARNLSINSYTEKLASKEITEREAASTKLVLGICDKRKSTTFVAIDPDNRKTRSPREIPLLLVLTIEKTACNGRANIAGPVSRCLSVARYFVSSRLTSSHRETLPTRGRFSGRCRNSSVTSSLETPPNTTYLSSVTPRFLSINGADPRIPPLSLSRCAQHALYAFRSKRYVACAWSFR